MKFARSSYPVAHWFYFVTIRWCFRALYFATGGLRVSGLEHLPGQGPVILAPNHKSLLDPWIMLAASPLTFRSMAGRDLFAMRGLGAFMSSMGAFPVTRGQSDPRGLAQARAYLEQGCAVVIFPEGRCSPDDELLPIQAGVAVMSLRLQVPIVPVAIRSSNRVLPLGARWLRRHAMEVEFGEPLRPPVRSAQVGRQVEALKEELESRLRQMLDKGSF